MTEELRHRIKLALNSRTITPNESIVLRSLFLARGRDHAVSGFELRRDLVCAGREVNRRALSSIVANLIETYRIPIGTSKGKPYGYYLTVTDADQEYAATELWAQIRSMIRRARVLSPKSRHGRELLGQLEAELAESEAA